MSSHLPLSFKELDQFLVEIRECIPYKEIHANTFFHLVKPTQENLSKYSVHYPHNRIFYILDLLKLIPLILYRTTASLLISLYELRDVRSKSLSTSIESKYLFVSHFTHAQDPNREDIFFGSNLDYEKSFAFYLNHTRLSKRNILMKYRLAGKSNIAVNSKALLPLPMTQLHFHQMRISWWLIKKTIGNKDLTVEKKRLLIKASGFQHHRSTIANLVFRKKLIDLILKMNPSYIVFTMEGHAHEKLIVDIKRNNLREVILVGYQHAPIVPGQLNLFRTVANLTNDDFFLTSGNVTKRLASRFGFPCKIETLGSLKSRDYNFQEKDPSRIQVLVAPEGTKESLIQLIRLINNLAPRMSSVSFVLRVHPALGRTGRKLIEKELSLQTKVVISTYEMGQDLLNSRFVLFRSSAIGIEALSSGVIPIHYSEEGGNLLNPILDCNLDIPEFSSANQILNFLMTFDPKQYQGEIFYKECYQFFNDYFGKLKNINFVVH